MILAASMSLIIGALFWDIPSTDAQLNLNDRLGFHYTIMCISIWPILITLTAAEIRRNRNYVERDIKDGLYGRFVYIITKVPIHECFYTRYLVVNVYLIYFLDNI